MSRSNRLFEIIQLLRGATAPLTARAIADTLEVTQRTVYRDIAALQSMRVPILGEAGIGYVMRAGFDLPPLMFTAEEIEAIVVGLALLQRTGDAGLQAAAQTIGAKIGEVLPEEPGRVLRSRQLFVSSWGAGRPPAADLRIVRRAIRDECKLRIAYEDEQARRTRRTILPLALIYYVEVVVLAAWCELRQGFRHFRVDRMRACKPLKSEFRGQGDRLRAAWQALHRVP